MPALAIDTATEVCAIALGMGGELIEEASLDAGRSHLEMLLPEINRMLNAHGFSQRDVQSIVAGIGPGTFTGLRVGIATARGLAQALEVPLGGFSTLEALALGMAENMEGGDDSLANNNTPDLLPVIDARRGQVFAQLFKRHAGGVVEAASEILCLEPEDLFKAVSTMTGGRVIAAGNGALAHQSQFEAAPLVELLARGDRRHRVRARHHLGAAVSGRYDSEALLRVLPVYVREPDADKTVLLRKSEPWLR